jgi:predicted nucleic acid-binding protein
MFIDTSGWYCSLVGEDHRHEAANSFYNDASRKITHSFVIVELVALCYARRFSRTGTLEFVSELFNDPAVSIIWVDEYLTKQALELLKQRLDKRWSLCDAVSFVVMTENGITECLTTDHHFEQAGFIQLLES